LSPEFARLYVLSGVLDAIALPVVRVEAHLDTTPRTVYGLVPVEIAVRLLTITDDLRAGFDPRTKIGHQCASSSVWNRNEKHTSRPSLDTA